MTDAAYSASKPIAPSADSGQVDDGGKSLRTARDAGGLIHSSNLFDESAKIAADGNNMIKRRYDNDLPMPTPTRLTHVDRLTNSSTAYVDFGSASQGRRPASLTERIWEDQKNFYSAESLTLLGGGLVIGGAMASSPLDESIHRHFQSSVRGATSDDWFESLHASKELGNGKFTLPVFAAAWAAKELFPENHLIETGGIWGERSIRGFIVGAPPLVVMQQLTGGSRPTETNENSEWQPLRDNNGISGHAFMGALPFITAAKMTDNIASLFFILHKSNEAQIQRRLVAIWELVQTEHLSRLCAKRNKLSRFFAFSRQHTDCIARNVKSRL